MPAQNAKFLCVPGARRLIECLFAASAETREEIELSVMVLSIRFGHAGWAGSYMVAEAQDNHPIPTGFVLESRWASRL